MHVISTSKVHAWMHADRIFCLVALLAALSFAGESPKPTQAEQDAIWQEAMRKSAEAEKARTVPPPTATKPPPDPKGDPAYQAAQSPAGPEVVDDLILTQRRIEAEARRKREEDEREKYRQERERREAHELAERRQAMADAEANEQRAREQAEQRRADERAAAETRDLVVGIIQLVLGIGVAVLPIVAASIKRSPQRSSVVALVTLAALTFIGGINSKEPTVTALAVVMWAAAWVVSLWNHRD